MNFRDKNKQRPSKFQNRRLVSNLHCCLWDILSVFKIKSMKYKSYCENTAFDAANPKGFITRICCTSPGFVQSHFYFNFRTFYFFEKRKSQKREDTLTSEAIYSFWFMIRSFHRDGGRHLLAFPLSWFIWLVKLVFYTTNEISCIKYHQYYLSWSEYYLQIICWHSL